MQVDLDRHPAIIKIRMHVNLHITVVSLKVPYNRYLKSFINTAKQGNF